MIIIGDIHGNYQTFLALLAKISESEKKKGIVITGDLIDRGPKSKEVIQYCMDNKIQVVRGNHEEMMIEDGVKLAKLLGTQKYISRRTNDWSYNGGIDTLWSYMEVEGKDDDFVFRSDVFKKHLKYVQSLPYFLEFNDVKDKNGRHLLVTHSSASVIWAWKDNKLNYKAFTDELIWGRPDEIDEVPNIFNVFGHTIVKKPIITDYYANIDTGCTYVSLGYGTLTALQFPEMIVYQQDNIDPKEGEEE